MVRDTLGSFEISLVTETCLPLQAPPCQEVKIKMLVTQLCLTLCDPMDPSPPGSSVRGILQARILEWGSHSLLHDIFPTPGLNLGLLHCRQIPYHLSHQGSPSLPELVSYSRIWGLSGWDWYPSSHMGPAETPLWQWGKQDFLSDPGCLLL